MPSTFVPRDGQLVAFNLPVKGAATSRRGFPLGIYHAAAIACEGAVPWIAPIDPDGQVVMLEAKEDMPAAPAVVNPAGLELEPVTNASGHWQPRSGQWVVVLEHADGRPLEVEGAHTTADGGLVGIYVPSGKDAVTGQRIDPHVVPVRADGTNVRVPNHQTNTFDLVTLDPNWIVFEPLLAAADLPPGRKTHDEWHPKP